MMRLPQRLSVTVAAFAVLFVCASERLHSQAANQSSSSQSAPVRTPERAPAPVYVSIDPLANVRYDNRYDVSVEMAYAHVKAGPNLLQGANLGGLIVQGSYWLTKRWGIEGTMRPYFGTSGAAPNPYEINGPFIAEYFFVAGPEWLGPHNKHGALIAHVMAGGVYGNFERNLRSNPTSAVGFYHDQVAPALIMGGHFDLNRSPRWVFRVTVDGLLTDYAINWGDKSRQIDINAAVSVGVEYKFKKTR
jgi:hypothetical protein